MWELTNYENCPWVYFVSYKSLNANLNVLWLWPNPSILSLTLTLAMTLVGQWPSNLCKPERALRNRIGDWWAGLMWTFTPLPTTSARVAFKWQPYCAVHLSPALGCWGHWTCHCRYLKAKCGPEEPHLPQFTSSLLLTLGLSFVSLAGGSDIKPERKSPLQSPRYHCTNPGISWFSDSKGYPANSLTSLPLHFPPLQNMKSCS